MPPTACDGCYRRKERCHFDATEERCRQCKLQQKECSFGRRSRRMGRPPATKKLPYGSYEIINFEVVKQHPHLTTNHPAPSAPSGSPSSYDTEPEMDSLGSLAPAPYEATACSHGLSCSSLADLFPLMDALDTVPKTLPHSLGSSGSCRYNPVHEVLSSPQSSDGVVLDAYSTVLALWDMDKNKIKGFGELDLGEGSHCLKRLQTPAIAHPEDAAAVVMLGQILVVYHIVVLGTSAHAILRRSLLLVKEWYPSLLNEPALYPITITPILIDTIESLIKREIPVIQAPPDDATDCSIVDRSAGVCLGLIHLQYEVCRIAYRAKTAAIITDGGSSESTSGQYARTNGEELDDIRRRVSNWEPRPSTSFFTCYTKFEVSAMMMQARVYRLATLLIIHRLQYPLGVEDDPAARLAMAIAAELECFVQWVPNDMKGIPIGFPLLVALLEIDGVSEKVIRYASPETAEPTYVDQLRAFIQLAKAARDSGFRGLWFDIAEDKLSIPVLA
ncbi:hypothetical protein EDB81DRAFT_861483 [Dactylonectria macrodidyma]|uniref:Zn(2)-C6 fungal-type domain-containing protein n=1 Tax=Dactylonectria macrodidyma TaxID=307937 RepID=A0A9P9DMB0_9HYPO|nr:hypothetical protein EDB81DRAFT_861483 [Dactylonectria macrodidyma]